MKFLRKSIVFLFLLSMLCQIGYAQERTIVKFGKDVVVKEGQVVDRAVAIGGNVTINGTARGDAVAIGGAVFLGPGAVVNGRVVSLGGEVIAAEGARIAGDVVEIDIPGADALKEMPREVTRPERWQGILWTVRIIRLIGFLVLAVLISAVMPGVVKAISDSVSHAPMLVLLIGLIGFLLVIPIAVILAISIIGIILIPLELIFVVVLTFLGYVSVAQLVGNRIIISIRGSATSLVWETFWGVIILSAISFIPVVGWIVRILVYLISFGGAIGAVFKVGR